MYVCNSRARRIDLILMLWFTAVYGGRVVVPTTAVLSRFLTLFCEFAGVYIERKTPLHRRYPVGTGVGKSRPSAIACFFFFCSFVGLICIL